MEYQNVTDNIWQKSEKETQSWHVRKREKKTHAHRLHKKNMVIIVQWKRIAANKQLYKYARGMIIGYWICKTDLNSINIIIRRGNIPKGRKEKTRKKANSASCEREKTREFDEAHVCGISFACWPFLPPHSICLSYHSECAHNSFHVSNFARKSIANGLS